MSAAYVLSLARGLADAHVGARRGMPTAATSPLPRRLHHPIHHNPWRPFRTFALIGVAAVLAASVGCDAVRDRWATATGSPARADDRAPLGLKLDIIGDDVRISWDRNAPAVAHAHRAVLTISERNQLRELNLEAVVLRTGSIVYTPLTDDVAFRLEVLGASGAATESVRFLRDSAVPPIDAALPPAFPPSPPPAAASVEPFEPPAAGRPAPVQEESDAAAVRQPAPVQENSNAADVRPLVRTDEPDDAAAVERMKVALNDQRYRWRSLTALAEAGAMTEKAALALLRAQPDVVIKFSRAKRWIARRADR